jgi:hypothetical protein
MLIIQWCMTRTIRFQERRKRQKSIQCSFTCWKIKHATNYRNTLETIPYQVGSSLQNFRFESYWQTVQIKTRWPAYKNISACTEPTTWDWTITVLTEPIQTNMVFTSLSAFCSCGTGRLEDNIIVPARRTNMMRNIPRSRWNRRINERIILKTAKEISLAQPRLLFFQPSF